MNSLICKSINQKKIVQFNYNGKTRLVEPHCHGETIAGNEGLRAYQIGGYSSSGNMGWKMYDLGKIDSIVLKESFFGPRPGYKKGDRGMSIIYCEL